MSSGQFIRLCVASGPWQVIMLAAALRECDREAGQGASRPRTILLLHDPQNLPGMRARLDFVTQRTESWDQVVWDKGLLTLKFADGEWPIPLDKYAAPIKDMVGVGRVDELWLCHLKHIEHHGIVEMYPEARICMYEDGLENAVRSDIRGWRDHLKTFWLAPRLLLHGRLGAYMRSVRLCDWRPSWFHIRRVKRLYFFLAARFPTPFPYRHVPVTRVGADAVKDILKLVCRSPVPFEWPPASPRTIDDRDILLLGQNVYMAGIMKRDEEESLYLRVVRELIAKGYRVWWKEHPREVRPFEPFLASNLPDGTFFSCGKNTWLPAEILVGVMPFRLCVSSFSTALFYLKDLCGVRTYHFGDWMRPYVKAADILQSIDQVEAHVPALSELPLVSAVA